MKYFKIIASVLIVGVLVYLGTSKLKSNKEIIDQHAQQEETFIKEIPVNIVAAREIKSSNELERVGTFEARKELSMIAETQGRITHLYITEGQHVKNGQPIAKIDDTSIQSQLSTAKAALQKSKKDLERYEILLSVGAISQTQYEEIELSVQNNLTNLTSIESQLKYTTVNAPMSGVISEIILEEGSFASPGTEIARIVDVGRLNLIVTVDETNVPKIKEKEQVKITTEVYPDHVIQGRIIQVGVKADAARKYEIKIEVANRGENQLKAGMYGTASIPLKERADESVLVIPRKSVVGSVKQPRVFVLKDGKAVLTDIRIGKNMDDSVVVLEGLEPGQQVITTGQINLDDGRAVKVIHDVSSN